MDNQAEHDFELAVFKGFWRKVLARLKRESNELLPFDEVRQRLPLQGQHYIGLQVVSLNKIVGSMGRYRDFDRAFLPIQTRTKDRWVNIDKAHHSQVTLPAVELFKIGDIYFVKDGNHRVSVARERGQEFIDAFVTEIDIPVPLSPDLVVNDLELKQEYASFAEKTSILRLRPGAQLESRRPGQYQRLLDHIAVHRWYLGEQQSQDVTYEEAVVSWYDNVYLPLIETLKEQNILKDFRGVAETDLYLWIMDYIGYLRDIYREEKGEDVKAKKTQAVKHLLSDHPLPPVKKLVQTLRRSEWIDQVILQQEWAAFNGKTNLEALRPGAKVNPSLPIQYERLLEHIAAHQWYLGEQRGEAVNYEEAVTSWYDNVYLPLVHIIREQKILQYFPGRTETDLYLWIIEHQWYLQIEYGSDVPLEDAAEHFTGDYSPHKNDKKKGLD
jgi:hypothetical protein